MQTAIREMRLTMRVLSHWRDAAEGRNFPRKSDIKTEILGDDWHFCLLINLGSTPDLARFAYVGEKLRVPSDASFENRLLIECPQEALLRHATLYIDRVLAKRVPISVGGSATHLGVPILFRSILMPLSENDDVVDGVFGAANYRPLGVDAEGSPPS